MTDAMTRHSDAEVLAAFVDGHLDREQLEAVTTHLATCEECRAVIGEAVAFEREETARKSPRRAWGAVAAAAILAIIVFPSAWIYFSERDIPRKKQAVFKAEVGIGKRATAGRFSDQDAYADYRPTRGGLENPQDVDDDRKLKLEEAAYKLLEKADKARSQEAARAAAFALVTIGDTKIGLARLERIPPTEREAATWNDIATIKLALNRPDEAREAIERALQHPPKMREALFTRATILRTLGDPEAAQAWNDYLAVDSTSRWADEAREKLDELRKPQ